MLTDSVLYGNVCVYVGVHDAGGDSYQSTDGDATGDHPIGSVPTWSPFTDNVIGGVCGSRGGGCHKTPETSAVRCGMEVGAWLCDAMYTLCNVFGITGLGRHRRDRVGMISLWKTETKMTRHWWKRLCTRTVLGMTGRTRMKKVLAIRRAHSFRWGAVY